MLLATIVARRLAVPRPSPRPVRGRGLLTLAAAGVLAAALGASAAEAKGPVLSRPSDATAEMLRVLGSPPHVAAPIGAARALTRKLRASLATAGDGRPASVRLVPPARGRPPRILVRGLADDSVAGFNLIVRTVPDSALGFRIRAVTRRYLCARGVDAAGRLCL
jgi:hypothetical protein